MICSLEDKIYQNQHKYGVLSKLVHNTSTCNNFQNCPFLKSPSIWYVRLPSPRYYRLFSRLSFSNMLHKYPIGYAFVKFPSSELPSLHFYIRTKRKAEYFRKLALSKINSSLFIISFLEVAWFQFSSWPEIGLTLNFPTTFFSSTVNFWFKEVCGNNKKLP